MRKNQEKSLRYALWRRGGGLIDWNGFDCIGKVRKPGWQFRATRVKPDPVRQCRTTPTVAAPDDELRRMPNTIAECHGLKRAPRRPARVPGTDAAPTTRRGAVRGPGCPPCCAGRRAVIGAGTTQSTTTRRDSRNSVRRWRRSVPAPPTRRVFPTRQAGTAGRYRRPNPGRKG